MRCSAIAAGEYSTLRYRDRVATAVRMLHGLDRLICRVGRSCCVARSQAAWRSTPRD
jgi:hypothetical protein